MHVASSLFPGLRCTSGKILPGDRLLLINGAAVTGLETEDVARMFLALKDPTVALTVVPKACQGPGYDVLDTEEWQIRHLSVGEHAVEEQRTPKFANFVRGLTSDFGEKANVYAETLFKEDIDGDELAVFSPGSLKELGLSLGDSFKLLHRFKEAQQVHKLEHPARSAMQMEQQGPPNGFPNGWEGGHLEAVRIPIPKDNNCLFTSIAYLCCDGVQDESVARSLRKKIADCILRDRITNNPPKYTDLLLGKPPLESCEWIKDDANWSGENEILILSEHYNVEITVIMMGDNVTGITYGETRGSLRSGRIFLLYTGQHYDALVGSEHEKPGGSVTRMICMFPAGVSEMCSLAVSCGVTEFEKASRNGVDTLAASMSSVRYAAQSGVGIDFWVSRYPKEPELERGDSPSAAPATAKKVGDRSGEGKVFLNKYEKAVAYLEAQEAMPKAAASVSAQSLAPTPGFGTDCDLQEYLQKSMVDDVSVRPHRFLGPVDEYVTTN
jgi:hypothetical protein